MRISGAWVLLTTACEFWDPKGSFPFSILVPWRVVGQNRGKRRKGKRSALKM